VARAKKAGEFYTPQAVSSLLAKIVTQGKTQLKSVYDPTCGSGSLRQPLLFLFFPGYSLLNVFSIWPY
jgi:hypothetical protein